MSDPHLLIFGMNGQLARELRERAPVAGWRVTTLGSDRADFCNTDATLAAMREIGPVDAVINASAYTAVDLAETEADTAHRVNAITPGALAELCAQSGTPFIQISTDYVFSGDKSGAYVETDKTGPRSVYGRTKLAGETAVAASGTPHAILRTAWVYAPHGKNFVRTMLRLAQDRDSLSVVADQRGCPTHAGDLAEGALRAAAGLLDDPDKSGVYHFAGSGETSWAEFAEAVFDLAEPHTGRRPTVTHIASVDYPTPAPRPANSVLNCDRFAETFGYRAPAWRASLAGVIAALCSGTQA
ncbi:dTDP-4-dehydrorhamnose reductase [Maricaulis sp.]|uniref:dTDP-4-dehydrorhamnose reductase n=1 Tax=Maricaulis sp. TaxID=1486257 RepID=UPI0025C00052|nr:dTDP-4-dehydrorhamnose reductase [Maricaulis sp.]